MSEDSNLNIELPESLVGLQEDSSAEEVDYSVEEVKAMEGGWRPRDEWEGDPEDFVDAREFNRRGELMGRISSQSSQIKQLEKQLKQTNAALSELGKHHQQVKQKAFEEAYEALKAQKAEALSMGEHELVVDIDEQLADLKKAKTEYDSTLEEQSIPEEDSSFEEHPAVTSWLEDHPQYNSDVVFQSIVDGLAKQYISQNGDSADPELLVKYVNENLPKYVGEKEPERTKRRSTVTETETTQAAPRKGKYTTKHLNEEQRKFAKSFVASGAFESEQDYVDSLASVGGLDIQARG